MALLTPPPVAPQRGDRTTFASRVDAFITWLINFVTELVALVTNLNSIAAGGAYSIPYTFDATATSDADPGSGKIRLDNAAAQNAAAWIYLDILSASGQDVTAQLNSFGSSTSATKGQVRLVKQGDPSRWIVANITAVNTGSGYMKLQISAIQGSQTNPFANGDAVILQYQRTGDKGDPGTAGAAGSLISPTLYVRDEKAQGTHGGALTSGAARTLNTVKVNSITGASLSSNRVTVPAGTYNILGRAPAGGSTAAHRVALWNTTDNSLFEVGSSEYSQTANDGVGLAMTRSIVEVRNVVLSAAKTFELRHYFSGNGGASAAGGWASNLVYSEVYGELIFEKVA